MHQKNELTYSFRATLLALNFSMMDNQLIYVTVSWQIKKKNLNL